MSIFYQFRNTLGTCSSLYPDYGDFFPLSGTQGGAGVEWELDTTCYQLCGTKTQEVMKRKFMETDNII